MVRTKPIELLEYPGVTVVVPCYNEEKTILPILEKLKELSIPQVAKEIIIVDDFSTDGTRVPVFNEGVERLSLIGPLLGPVAASDRRPAAEGRCVA